MRSSEILFRGPPCCLTLLWYHAHHAAVAVRVLEDTQSSSGFLAVPQLTYAPLLENRTALWPFFPFRGAHVASDKPCLPQAASFLREEKGCSRISAAWVMKWRRRHGGKIREFQTPPSHSLAPCFSLNLKEKNVIQNSFHKSQL